MGNQFHPTKQTNNKKKWVYFTNNEQTHAIYVTKSCTRCTVCMYLFPRYIRLCQIWPGLPKQWQTQQLRLFQSQTWSQAQGSPVLIVTPLSADPPHLSARCVCRTPSRFLPKQTSLWCFGPPTLGLSAALCLPTYWRSLICSGACCAFSLTLSASTDTLFLANILLLSLVRISCTERSPEPGQWSEGQEVSQMVRRLIDIDSEFVWDFLGNLAIQSSP